jgi:hypothetical protein
MEDRTHQIKAEEFATKEEHAGKLSPAQAARIRAKAKRLQLSPAARCLGSNTNHHPSAL